MGFRLFLVYIFRKNLKKLPWVLLAFLVGIYFYGQLLSRPDGRLHVRFLDVGQGDSIFITSAKGSHVIIDGGLGEKVLPLINQFMVWGDRRIDLMILTHPHADHIGGLVGILRNYDVKNIIYEPESYKSRVYKSFLTAVKDEESHGAKVLKVKTGDLVKIGDLNLKIIWDPKESSLRSPPDSGSEPTDPVNSNANNQSIVAELSYGDFDVFLAGDAQEAEARDIISAGVDILPVEVYKASHHGSRNGLNAAIISQLSPKLAVISAGKNNSYGHPHGETLNLLAQLKSRVLRTDLDGTIEVVSDGSSWSVK